MNKPQAEGNTSALISHNMGTEELSVNKSENKITGVNYLKK